MLPSVLGLPTRPFVWMLAAIVGIWLSAHCTRRDGLPQARSLLLSSCSALAILAGAKVLYMLEQVSGLAVMGDRSAIATLEHGFRLPGGIVLWDLALPLFGAAAGLSWRRFADAAAPGVSAAIVIVRLGCFLNGCCFGAGTDTFVGIRFPPGALAYEWQLDHGQITVFDTHSAPVHPLQLYFGLLALMLTVVTLRMQTRKRFEGHVWLVFNFLYFVGSGLLEFVRDVPFPLNLIVAAVGGALAALALARQWRGGVAVSVVAKISRQ